MIPYLGLYLTPILGMLFAVRGTHKAVKSQYRRSAAFCRNKLPRGIYRIIRYRPRIEANLLYQPRSLNRQLNLGLRCRFWLWWCRICTCSALLKKRFRTSDTSNQQGTSCILLNSVEPYNAPHNRRNCSAAEDTSEFMRWLYGVLAPISCSYAFTD